MPLDTFICGSCMVSFNDIEQFILHKNDACGGAGKGPTTGTQPQMEVETSAAVESVTSLTQIAQESDLSMGVTDGQGNIISSSATLPGTESLLANSSEVFSGDNQQTVIILQGDLPNLNLEGAGQLLAEMTQQDKITVETTLPSVVKKKRGRGPGRPKKVTEKPKFDPSVKNEPEVGSDGKLLCRRCKRTFTKERVFNAHKCLALSEYIDFTTKDIPDIDPDDNHLPQDDLEDSGAMDLDDNDTDFKVPLPVPGATKRDHHGDEHDSDMDIPMTENETTAGIHEEGEVLSQGQEESVKAEQGGIGPVEVDANPDIEESHIERETDQINNLPVFLNDADKAAFEASLNVDISCVDNMFRVHSIEQELNQNASQLSRFPSNHLSLYSCNVCDKVFKSLSHMRFHSLTHTELKPFKCIKCNYCSNARGNLYTHMRKHTGQFYRCDKCRFRTVNKSHLVEHEMTHTKVKRQCQLCRKFYNTLKSLMSHIRKYHDNAKGKEYLSSFMQGRDVRGTTVIHQCHVCNRKFKKKMDRDRHLFVHDIRDLPNTQHCHLCDYTASRPKYLEKHFQKHRCIYRCCKCDEMFLSSLRLVEHLTGVHMDYMDSSGGGASGATTATPNDTWEAMFEASIAHSLYLPEPDQVLPQEEKDLINLPTELSESGLDQIKLQNPGEDDLGNNPIESADVFINKVPAETSQQELSEHQPESVINHTEDIHTTVLDPPESMNNPEKDQPSISPQPESHVTPITDNNPENPDTIIAGETSIPTVCADSNHNNDTIKDPADQTDETGESMLEETNMTEEDLLGVKSGFTKSAELVKKLGYLSMTIQIYQKMRDTFGTEECEFCGRLFFSRADYEPHVRTHTGDKPHVCETCGYRAITRDNLKRHVEKEHEKITYPCKECPFVATSRTQLWNHTMRHRGLKGLECPECHIQVETLKELKNHAAMMHPNSNQEELEKLIYRHRAQGKLGRRSYKCPHCDKVFFRASSELQKHMWIHEGIKPFKCPQCPHACRSKNNLQAHMLRHSKDKPFSCEHCGKAYKSKTALRWHVRSHADGKLFKCDKCPYEATQRSHLKRHLEIHEVVKRYCCSICDFSANTIGYLKLHYTRFHKDIDPSTLSNLGGTTAVEVGQPERNVFKCLSCDYLFGNLSDLKRHLRTRHHVNVQEIQKVEGNEVQVVQIEDGSQAALGVECVTETAVETQVTTEQSMDEKTASAVDILQHIIDMSQNGSLTQQRVVTAGPGGATGPGTVLQVNTPETIIVQQDGAEMTYVTNVAGEDGTTTTEIDGSQYVIQYVTPHEEVPDGLNMIEVQGEEMEVQDLGELHTEVVTS